VCVAGCWREDYRSRAREWSSKVSTYNMKLEDKIIIALIIPVIMQAALMVGITAYGFILAMLTSLQIIIL
jgi:hypothetical protein